MYIAHISCFLKLERVTEKLKRTVSEKLREDYTILKDVKIEHRIYIRLPKDEDHQGHIIGEVSVCCNYIEQVLSRQRGSNYTSMERDSGGTSVNRRVPLRSHRIVQTVFLF